MVISIYELIFKSINPYSISILILFILYVSNLKKFNNKEKIIILSLLISFFSIFAINLIRANFLIYYIYIDYILVFLIGLVLIKINKNIGYLIAVFIIFINIYFKYDQQFITQNNNSINLCKEFNENPNNFLITWHKKIPKEKFHAYCLKYN